MDFKTLAKERYSCRKFSDKPVEKEKIAQIVETALTAPTAVNKQPYRIWVMESEEAVQKIVDSTRFSFDAKVFLVVGYTEEEAWMRKYDGRNFADVDASIVASQIMFAIHDMGLGSTWVGHFNAPKLKELCPQMADYELIAIFPIGYPAEDAQPAPGHFEKRDVAEIVTYL